MSPDVKKGCGITPSGCTWYIDHLAVICSIMKIPLLFLEELDFSLGKKYYPNLKCELISFDDFSPEYLTQNFDVLYMSDLWDRDVFHRNFDLWEKKFSKQMRHVYCPHGFSDKAFHLKHAAREDIALIYGDNMLDMLKHENMFDEVHKIVMTGNHRYTYYKNNKEFFDHFVKEEILEKFNDPSKPIILYAPTWMDHENSSTFFDSNEDTIGKLPQNYNLIVKLHPRLELDDAGLFHQIIGKYQPKKNVVFLHEFPLIYPILEKTDIYLGDASSVGYDFLTYNRPMFFLNKEENQKKSFLFQCGTEITKNECLNLYKIIEHNLKNDFEKYSGVRSKIYEYTFGKERSFEDIRKDIKNAYTEDPIF